MAIVQRGVIGRTKGLHQRPVWIIHEKEVINTKLKIVKCLTVQWYTSVFGWFYVSGVIVLKHYTREKDFYRKGPVKTYLKATHNRM